MAKKISLTIPTLPKINFEKFTPAFFIMTIVLSFIVGILWEKVNNLEKIVGGSSGAQTQAAPSPVLDLKVVKGLWDKNIIKFGDANRRLLLVEVVDPSCPYCHVAGGHDSELAIQIGTQFKYVSSGGNYIPPVPEMKKLVDSGKASLAVVYFPGHSNGEMGMKALYCAFDQGKFWQAHDLLMSNAGYNLMNNTVKNDKTKSGLVADFLKKVVDSNKLKTCIDSGKYDARLTEEQNLAQSSLMDPQQGGTPTFIMNTIRFNGAYSWTDMKSTADAALK